MNTTRIGKKGEKIACDYLIKNEFEICETNFRYRRNEIDIIAKKNNLLLFIEVKFRKSTAFGYPEEAVDTKKIQCMKEAAEYYIEKINWIRDIRFDTISILMNKEIEIIHFKDSF